MTLGFMQVRAHQNIVRPARTPSAANNHVSSVAMSLPDTDFTLTVRRQRDRLIVALSGVLDESTVGDLRSTLVRALEEAEQSVILDVTNVPLIDSDGFGALINIQKRLTEAGKSLALTGCQEAVRLALSLTRLEVLFPCYPTNESVP